MGSYGGRVWTFSCHGFDRPDGVARCAVTRLGVLDVLLDGMAAATGGMSGGFDLLSQDLVGRGLA